MSELQVQGKRRCRELPKAQSSPNEQEHARRDRRVTAFGLLTSLWALTSLDRVKKCCRCSVVGGSLGPVLRGSVDSFGRRRAGFTGLSRCGSVWVCPVCSRKVSAQRADEISGVLRAVTTSGGSAMLLTLTVGHQRGMPLKNLWSAIGKSWAAVIGGAPWKKMQAEFGVLGWCRTVEVRLSARNGWHPHVHALVFFDRELSEDSMRVLCEKMWNRWSCNLGKLGYKATAQDLNGHSVGRDFQKLRMTASDATAIGNYLTKVAFEVTSKKKKDHTVSRSPMGLLADVIEHGHENDRDLALWHEYEQASKGKRQLTWSANLKAWAKDRGNGVDIETNEEIVEKTLDGEDFVQVTGGWYRIVHRQNELLDAYEVGGLTMACTWLDRAGVSWQQIIGRDDGYRDHRRSSERLWKTLVGTF